MRMLAAAKVLLVVLLAPVWAEEPDHRALVKLRPEDRYVCHAGHFHLTGTAENTSDVTLNRVMIEGRLYGEGGKHLSTAVSGLDREDLGPKEEAPFDIEFPHITGPQIGGVTHHELKVLQAEPKR